jgi:hypothetical protein
MDVKRKKETRFVKKLKLKNVMLFLKEELVLIAHFSETSRDWISSARRWSPNPLQGGCL